MAVTVEGVDELTRQTVFVCGNLDQRAVRNFFEWLPLQMGITRLQIDFEGFCDLRKMRIRGMYELVFKQDEQWMATVHHAELEDPQPEPRHTLQPQIWFLVRHDNVATPTNNFYTMRELIQRHGSRQTIIRER